jgi:hypothetical protein
MKKLLVILTLPLFLMSCGGDEKAESPAQASLIAAATLPYSLAQLEAALTTNVDYSDTCPAGGTIAVTEPENNLKVTMTNCAVLDGEEGCNSGETITANGTITFAFPSITGTITTTGFVEDVCVINLSLLLSTFDDIDIDENTQISNVFSGTLCGYDISEFDDVDTDELCNALLEE